MEKTGKDKESKSNSSKTKRLAKELGLLPAKRKAVDRSGRNTKRRKGQLLSYVIVIDFESTCWKDKRGRPEIIEFPAVLLDLSVNKIASEFHHYVSPMEQPILSSFCKELTGISQSQVDNGIPLPTCLYLFKKWVEQLKQEMGVVLMEPGREYVEQDDLCALVTWSDWDLEVCLNNECSRKQIKKPAFFNQWIDIRAVYKTFYERKPAGLNGALEDLGIKFVGRQHSGIDDAKNTAKLCFRMVRDGCRLTITKCIQKQRPQIGPPAPSRPPLRNTCNTTTSCMSSLDGGKPQTSQSSSSSAQALISSGPKLEQDHRTGCQPISLQPPLQSSPGKPKAFENSYRCVSSPDVKKDQAGCESIPGDQPHARAAAVVKSDGECENDWEELFGTELFKDFVSEMDVWEEDQSALQRTEKASSLGRSSASSNLKEQMAPVRPLAPSSNLEEQTGMASLVKTSSLNLEARKRPLARSKPFSDLPESKAPSLVRSLNKGRLLSAGVCSASSPAPTTTTTGTAAQGSAAQLNPTPSMPQFVTHVTPLTLLPASAASTLGLHHRGFYGADKEPLRSENSKASKLSSASLGPVVREGRSIRSDSHDSNVVGEIPSSDALLQQRESLDLQMTHQACTPVIHASPVSSLSPCTVKETPPSNQGISPSDSSSASLVEIKGTLSKPNTIPVSGESFKTPNSAQWLKMKNSFSPSNQLTSLSWCSTSSISGIFPSGGKITPPLCGCGRRAKRKVVSSPGPNEGKPFYVCPNSKGSNVNRKQGCNYFKWEFSSADCSNLARPLLSDYGE